MREDLDRERTERRQVRDELAEERWRREQAERERDELALKLDALQEARDAPETVSEGESGNEAPADDTGDPRQRSWLARFFGIE